MGTLDERVGLAMGRGRGGKTDHEGYHSVQVDSAALTPRGPHRMSLVGAASARPRGPSCAQLPVAIARDGVGGGDQQIGEVEVRLRRVDRPVTAAW